MLASKLRMTGEAARVLGRRILHRCEEAGLPREDQIPDRRVLFNLSRRVLASYEEEEGVRSVTEVSARTERQARAMPVEVEASITCLQHGSMGNSLIFGASIMVD
jgi:hypothetical protein